MDSLPYSWPVSGSTTLETFRQHFDGIVAKYGWDYHGGRNWRSRVIYDTNLRTSYAAGRYQQMKAVAQSRPFWHYRHSHASAEPRQQHLHWDGLILNHNDPFWNTHYPPNGWGCKCYVETLSQRDLDRLGKPTPDTTPPITTRDWVNKSTGQIHQVPSGIDPGWAHAPGRTSQLGEAVQHRIRQSTKQSVAIASRGVEQMLNQPRTLSALTTQWQHWRKQGEPVLRDALEVGALKPGIITTMNKTNTTITSAAITITRSDLAHLIRDSKKRRSQALDEDDLDRLPEGLAHPEAVLLDTEDQALLYVFTPANDNTRKGKVVIRVNYKQKMNTGRSKQTQVTHSIRTAGYVSKRDLNNPRYQVIEGEIK